MKIFKWVVFAIAILIFLYFFRFGTAPYLDKKIYSTFNSSQRIITPETKDECLKKNGEWRKPGPWPKEVCMMKTKDANKFCFSGFQCQTGYCLHRIDLRNLPVFAFGQCPAYQIFFGCLQEVHFGVTGKAVCLD